MANTFEDFKHSSLLTSYVACFKEKNVGIFFSNVIMSLCILVGTPAHLWCLRLEWKVKQLQVFHLNHTVMELIYCAECLVEMLNTFFFRSDVLFRGLFFFLCLSWAGRPLMQICICVEQYLAVLHPVTFLRFKKMKYRIAAAANAWFITTAYGGYKTFTLNFPDPIIDCIFLIAVTVISFCCVSVLCALKNPGPGDPRNKNQTRDAGNKQKRNAFNIIFKALLIILLTYLPQVLLTSLKSMKIDKELLDCNIFPFVTSLNSASVVIVPLMKIYSEGHIRAKRN